MEWISVKEKDPKFIGDCGDFKFTEYLLVRFDKEPEEHKYSIARMEAGSDWVQWYCPKWEDVINTPDWYCYIK